MSHHFTSGRVARTDLVLKTGRQQGGFAAPVPKVFVPRSQPTADDIGHPLEDPPQTVLRDAKPEPLLQNF